MRVRKEAAVVAYVALAVGFCVFCVSEPPATPGFASALRSSLRPAVFGLVMYVVYNATAASVLDGWSWKVARRDALWGLTLFPIGYVSAYTLVPVRV